ncbi:hypothetical protein LEP1GSC173_0948 [Leptospira interrogans str. HAI1594]|uniref:Uncharacterized protein n=8 Tax=Leptospira interrogans TaxID=173 RepID=M3IA46_LEPIR|nr:hypothetical protein G436_1467 [Leptospira interrogans serovar Hardjo str. Norma]EJP16872.1 hypothetical protein LEP1GSC080_2391 [Leptospira interrogans str. FPW2026]EKN96732.1 hypothetical protein LEP1GSC014_1265 [Leptospira interrogans serovar Pomona str. Pomona]EKO26054.1 hypothetical protein LEP1GSC104_1653 [Leptospira interrogans str. UI 12621]EKO95744.1 hypothetical protein LEP1GSC057_0936 [Leptospira interrogans str. Brem 329]EKP22239.1 hypothetical protein LEP1GSC117_3878 [Leptospir
MGTHTKCKFATNEFSIARDRTSKLKSTTILFHRNGFALVSAKCFSRLINEHSLCF